MKTKLLGTAVFGLTLASVVYYPQLTAKNIPNGPPGQHHVTAKPKIDVVFVLDTTSSMTDLIETAKEKIWSIATTMASAQQSPEIRIGLVAYRDRGDAYVTKVVDLSADLDSVYATLMDFQADGGGDGPESVNKALYDAVHNISWSQQDQTYQVIFLVGDAPPHMDYNEVRYPDIVAAALDKGIVVNTIQCGNLPMTVAPWTQIASLSHGEFFQVEQTGSAVAITTPYDEKLAELSAQLDDTRLYYGTDAERERMQEKVVATDKIHAGLSPASRARRAEFNASEGGRTNLLGENELVAAVADGTVVLDELDKGVLPEPLKAMAPAAQAAFVAELSEKREDLQRQIQVLSQDRRGYIAKKVDEAGGMRSSLDQKLFDAVKEQAGGAGFEYKGGPAY